MIITENPEKGKLLLDALRESFRETRGTEADPGIHLSDLLYPRKSYWNRQVRGVPDVETALRFTAGRAHEDVISQLGAWGFEPGKKSVKHGISYRPDFRWDGLPTEMKSSRKPLPTPGQEVVAFGIESWCEQLCGYCWLDGVQRGYLIVFDILTPALAVYLVDFASSEIERMSMTLAERRDELIQALALQRHDTLPLCPAGFCGSSVKQEIAPAYCQDCKADLTRAQVRKHTKPLKKYRNHVVSAPIWSWGYTPRCPHYQSCKPWERDPVRRAQT